MADLTPTTATNASALGGTERVPCTQAGADRALTPAQLQTAFQLAGALALQGLPLPAYKSADQSVNNSTTLVSDTHLTKTVTASHKYLVLLALPFDDNSTLAAGGLKITFSGTATYTNLLLTFLTFDLSAGLSQFGRIVAKDAEAQLSPALIDSGLGLIFGTVEINAGGTFLLKWAQQAATAGNTTLLRGGVMELIDLG